jgi:methylisocitrate lyase
MSDLCTDDADRRPPGARLAALLDRPAIVRAPGAHDALSGLLARRAGFEALYLSGAALSASLGLPDIGLTTLDELSAATRALYRATGLPVIVDADTGFGGAIAAMRTVRDLEAAGAAAVQIEDQVADKRCGHLDGKRLVPADEMAAKVAAARQARRDLLIVARTDAIGEGLDAAIGRGRLYVEAGADIVFADALASEDDFGAFADAVDAPVLANMTEFGKTPHITASRFEELGVRIVIWPASSLRVAARAVEGLYAHIRENDGTEDLHDRMQTRAELYDTIGYDAYAAIEGEER